MIIGDQLPWTTLIDHPAPLPLESRHHSTALPSLRSYEGRYEEEVSERMYFARTSDREGSEGGAQVAS